MSRLSHPIRLPRSLQSSLNSAARALLDPPEGPSIDFCAPAGEAALTAPDSVSWRIFKNPVSLMVGGIAAVILELAEPAVRTGVWQQSAFRRDPMGRLRRTGMAAMVTVYGARSIAVPMIEGVVRMHSRVAGTTPDGRPFSASDPALLRWVHATASFGFAAAYAEYVTPLPPGDFDAVYREGEAAAGLYGATDPPRSRDAVGALFDSMREHLEPSPIILEFLHIMRGTRALPPALHWLQPMLVRAAVDLLPGGIRDRLQLGGLGLRRPEGWIVRLAGALADRVVMPESPPAQACQRLGLPAGYLYR